MMHNGDFLSSFPYGEGLFILKLVVFLTQAKLSRSVRNMIEIRRHMRLRNERVKLRSQEARNEGKELTNGGIRLRKERMRIWDEEMSLRYERNEMTCEETKIMRDKDLTLRYHRQRDCCTKEERIQLGCEEESDK